MNGGTWSCEYLWKRFLVRSISAKVLRVGSAWCGLAGSEAASAAGVKMKVDKQHLVAAEGRGCQL